MFHNKSFMSAFALSVGLFLASLGLSAGLVRADQGVTAVGQWNGSETISTAGRFSKDTHSVTFLLTPGGNAIMIEPGVADGRHNGKYWRRADNTVIMDFDNSIRWRFEGTLRGDTLSGTDRRNDGLQTSTFSLER